MNQYLLCHLVSAFHWLEHKLHHIKAGVGSRCKNSRTGVAPDKEFRLFKLKNSKIKASHTSRGQGSEKVGFL